MHKKSWEHFVVWKAGKVQTKILSKNKTKQKDHSRTNLNKLPLAEVGHKLSIN